MTAPAVDLVTIPMVDVREGGAVRHAIDGCARARALGEDCLTWLLPAARMVLPLMDRISRRWLEGSQWPYLGDVKAIAQALGSTGIWFLNSSYQWCYTPLA